MLLHILLLDGLLLNYFVVGKCILISMFSLFLLLVRMLLWVKKCHCLKRWKHRPETKSSYSWVQTWRLGAYTNSTSRSKRTSQSLWKLYVILVRALTSCQMRNLACISSFSSLCTYGQCNWEWTCPCPFIMLLHLLCCQRMNLWTYSSCCLICSWKVFIPSETSSRFVAWLCHLVLKTLIHLC